MLFVVVGFLWGLFLLGLFFWLGLCFGVVFGVFFGCSCGCGLSWDYGEECFGLHLARCVQCQCYAPEDVVVDPRRVKKAQVASFRKRQLWLQCLTAKISLWH